VLDYKTLRMIEVGFNACNRFLNLPLAEQFRKDSVLFYFFRKVITAFVNSRDHQLKVPHQGTLGLDQSLTPGQADHDRMELDVRHRGQRGVGFSRGIGIGFKCTPQGRDAFFGTGGNGSCSFTFQDMASRVDIFDFGNGEMAHSQTPIGQAGNQTVCGKSAQGLSNGTSRHSKFLRERDLSKGLAWNQVAIEHRLPQDRDDPVHCG